MKKTALVMLTGILILTVQQMVHASDDHSDGYSSKFYGTVEEMPSGYIGTWIVNGRQVEVTQRTKIEQEYGPAAVGSYVEIKGNSDGQVFTAYELEVKQGRYDSGAGTHYEHSGTDEFYGTITSMPQGRLGTWIVDGREIYVNERTRIDEEDGPAKTGARVEVKGSFQKDTFVARKIEVKR